MHIGLRGRIVLLVLIALVPPSVVAVGVAFEERTEARDHAEQDVLDSTRLTAADVRRVFDASAGFMAAVSSNLARHPDRAHCESLLALVPRSTDRYSAVGVADAHGRVYCGATAAG